VDEGASGAETPIAAVSVAVRRGSKVLLVRRGRAPSKDFYAFPGGRVEPGETLEGAARRELLEETGLAAGGLTILREMLLEPVPGDPAPVFHLTVFGCEDVGGIVLAADDAAEAGYFSLEEMRGLPVLDSVTAVAEALLRPPR
jgi:8-oxo-dGTP diphosphatase